MHTRVIKDADSTYTEYENKKYFLTMLRMEMTRNSLPWYTSIAKIKYISVLWETKLYKHYLYKYLCMGFLPDTLNCG